MVTILEQRSKGENAGNGTGRGMQPAPSSAGPAAAGDPLSLDITFAPDTRFEKPVVPGKVKLDGHARVITIDPLERAVTKPE